MISVSRSVSRPVSRSILAGQSNTLASIIKSLFANNEQGFVYDPNDLSTMFQDAAGNVPVTGVGQAVGLMLDKSKGLTLGAELVVDSEFNDAAKWVLTAGASVSGGKLSVTASVGGSARQNFALKQAGAYKVTLKVDSASGSDYAIRLHNDGSIASTFVYTSGVGTKSWIITATSPFNALVLQFGGGAGLTAVFDSLSVVELKGNHAYQTNAASRPILRQNAITGAYYLEFDGSDDFLVTNNIDFTATNKLSLFTGVQKMPATTTNMLCELSWSSSAENQVNTFYLAVPETSAGTIFFRSRATSAYGQVAIVESGGGVRNCVITAKSDIPNDLNTIRLDGVSGIPSTADLGVGNLGNYPLFIGRRGGTTLPFNGHLYSLIGIGRLTTDAETIALEKSVAKNTGVTLSV